MDTSSEPSQAVVPCSRRVWGPNQSINLSIYIYIYIYICIYVHIYIYTHTSTRTNTTAAAAAAATTTNNNKNPNNHNNCCYSYICIVLHYVLLGLMLRVFELRGARALGLSGYRAMGSL